MGAKCLEEELPFLLYTFKDTVQIAGSSIVHLFHTMTSIQTGRDQGPYCESKIPDSWYSSPSSSGCLENNVLMPKFTKNSASTLLQRLEPDPTFLRDFSPDTHLGRQQSIGVELLHFGHQIVSGERHILYKLPV